MNSILNTVKKDLGIVPEYTHFDDELIADINTVFSILTQIGVGPNNGFKITDEYDTWDDYTDRSDIESVKSYVSKRVKLMFDPPLNGSVTESLKNLTAELEWRLNVAVDEYHSDKGV